MAQQLDVTNLAVDRDLHQQLKAIAEKEQRDLQVVVDRLLRFAIKAESKVKPS